LDTVCAGLIVAFGAQMRPYLEGDGDAVLDAIDWAEIRDANSFHP
jgi:hypothetical protein